MSEPGPEAPIPVLVAILLACASEPVGPEPIEHEPIGPEPVAPVAAAEAPPARTISAQPARIVAIGDLHGDLDNAIAALHLAGITDAQGHWAGGDAVLVQTGDTTDRGADSKQIMDLMQQLEREAPSAGGRVVALVGNHEAMNLLGDWRYVHAEDVVAFGGAEARREAFAPDGPYGRWLIERGVVAQVGDAVFAHGGIRPEWAAKGIDGINEEARAALRAGEPAPVLGPEGPLWYRGFVQDPEEVACPLLAESLAALGARRMVVGHTTRSDGRIEARCGGRLQVVDIGIADHYGGNLGALEIVAADARALYPGGPVDLEDPE